MSELTSYSNPNGGGERELKNGMRLQAFQNDLFGTIRTVLIDDEPYFVGRDIAIALGYSDPLAAISQHVENEDRAKHPIPDSQGFTQNTTIINESGFYSLVFGIKLPLAKEFKKWVTSDVLPSIRKTGGYIHTTDEDTPDMILAKAIKIAEAKIESQKKAIQSLKCDNKVLVEKNKELTPKAKYTDDVLMSESAYTITQVAKEFGYTCEDFAEKFLKSDIVKDLGSGMFQVEARRLMSFLNEQGDTREWSLNEISRESFKEDEDYVIYKSSYRDEESDEYFSRSFYTFTIHAAIKIIAKRWTSKCFLEVGKLLERKRNEINYDVYRN